MHTFIYALILQAAILGGESPRLKVSASIAPEKARPGERVELVIDCEIQPGWHVYAPSFKGTGTPLKLKVDPGALVPDGKLLFPEPRRRRDEALGEEVLYHEGKVRLSQALLVSGTAPAGKAEVAGSLTYQACTEMVCEPPTDAPITAEVKVLPAAQAPARKDSRAAAAIFQVEVEPARLASRGRGDTVVRYKIAKGSHIYSTDHKAEVGKPTQVLLDEKVARSVDPAKLKPPPAEEDFLGEKHRVLKGEGEIRQGFVLEGLPEGKAKLPVVVRYMLCDDKSCTEGEFKTEAALEVLRADEAAPPGKGPSGGKAAFRASLEPARPARGGKAELVLKFEVPPGGRIYSPDEDMDLATRIEVDPRFAVPDGPPAFPAPKTIDEDGRTRRVLEGSGEIRLPLRIAEDAPAEGGTLGVTVTWSAASGTSEVVRLGLPLDFSLGWLGLIFLAVAAGAVSVLMPCTYPMIPITISYFTRQAEARGGTAVSLALAYGAGIVLDFVLIGLLVGPPIVHFAGHWVTNLAVAVLFVVFGLSLLGLFEVRLPSSLNTLASRAAGARSFAGVFLLGTTVVITSFACTGPFIAGVLASGTQARGFLEVLVSMSFFGLTMALPFVTLALFPGAARSLPRSGEWMHTLKVLFGFLVLAAALPFLSKVDAANRWNAFPRELYLYILAGIAFTAALYLLGVVRLKGENGEIGPLRLVFGMLVLIFALYAVYGAQGNRLGWILESTAPAYGAERLGGGEPRGGPEAPSWTKVEDDFEGGLARARSEARLAILNWGGVNCTNCKVMELTIFPRPEVLAELRKYVEVRLHTDRDNPASKMLKEIKEQRLHDLTMPIYEIVDPVTRSTIDVFKGADILTKGAKFREFLARNAK